MRIAAPMLCIVVGLACSTRQAGAQSAADEGGQQGVGAEEAAPPSVTVLSPGKRPYQVLRWRFERGARRSVALTADTAAALSVDGRPGPSSKLPPITHTMEVEVQNVSPEGDALLGFVVTRAALASTKGLDPEFAGRMQSALDSMVGMRGSYRFTTRGFIDDVRLHVPHKHPPEVRQLIENMRQSIRLMAAPLPERRVGRGAKWRVDTTTDLSGVEATQSAVFRVVQLRRPRVDVEINAEQHAEEQKINASGLPEEEWPQLDSLRATGSGSARWNLREPSPLETKMSVSFEMHARVRDESARERAMMMTMLTHTNMISDPSSAPPSGDDFDAATVQARIKNHLWRIRGCYEDELPGNRELSGKIVMEFQIEESGRVSRAEALQNTTGSETMEACVANELLILRFDRGPEGGGAVFTYPFVFEPAQE
ncbi:MAG: AgmX/PglI C-terminal domain-containing protein [Polyangiales bacterium]